MNIAKRKHTVGNVKRYVLNYSNWLEPGISISSATVTSSSLTCTVSGVAHTADKIIFLLSGGALSETLTLSVAMTDTRTQVKNDTIAVEVVAP